MWSIANKYDLIAEIVRTINHNPVNFQHVKGHQDKNKNVNKLAYKAQLNIGCDKQACEALEKLPINLYPNLISQQPTHIYG